MSEGEAELRDEIAHLRERQQAHLAQIAKLSQTVPLESEVVEALNQRGVLLAEIGTLKSRCMAAENLLRDARTIADAVTKCDEDLTVNNAKVDLGDGRVHFLPEVAEGLVVEIDALLFSGGDTEWLLRRPAPQDSDTDIVAEFDRDRLPMEARCPMRQRARDLDGIKVNNHVAVGQCHRCLGSGEITDWEGQPEECLGCGGAGHLRKATR